MERMAVLEKEQRNLLNPDQLGPESAFPIGRYWWGTGESSGLGWLSKKEG